MKIVQSYWSKPAKMKENTNPNGRSAGGWIDKKYNYMSWAFSCLQFKKYYDEIELITDKEGHDLLINKLGLPYTRSKVVLDSLNDYSEDLWALGKLYAYRLQDKPFIHADGDVYIWDRLPHALENSPILAQNCEMETRSYNLIYEEVIDSFRYVPKEIVDQYVFNNPLNGINAGIIGGNDMDFFKEYTDRAFKMVNDNIDLMDAMDKGRFNIFYEQCIFYSLAQSKGLKINYLVHNVNEEFDGISNLTAAPSYLKYAHTVSGYKKRKDIGELLAHMLLESYPEYYFRIQNLIRNHNI